MLCVYYPYCQRFVSCVQGNSQKRPRPIRSVKSASYAVRVAGWLNALAATLDLDGVELGLGGDGHGGGDVDAEKKLF